MADDSIDIEGFGRRMDRGIGLVHEACMKWKAEFPGVGDSEFAAAAGEFLAFAFATMPDVTFDRWAALVREHRAGYVRQLALASTLTPGSVS